MSERVRLLYSFTRKFPGSSVGQLRFLLSLITRDNDYQREQAKAAEAAALRLHVDLESLYADNDSVTQSSQILDAIHKYKSSLSGILVEPAGGTEFPQIGRAAVTGGIAWVVLNRNASSLRELRRGTVPAFAVSSNHTEVGRIQARQLAVVLPEGGLVLCIQGPSNSLAAHDRMAGLLEAQPSNVTLKVIKSNNWTEEGGHHAVASWLRLTTSQQQRIVGVVAQNDFIAIGAKKAFAEMPGVDGQRSSKLPFLGVDGQPTTGRAWVSQGLLTATVVVLPVAGSALEAAVAAISQKKQPHDLQLIGASSFPPLTSLRPVPAARS